MNRHAVVLALLSAALFGVSTPAAKALLGEISPTVLAGLFYCGAGIGIAILRRARQNATGGLSNPGRHDQGHRDCHARARGCHQGRAASWNGVFGPRNLPEGIQAKLNDAVVRALDDPDTLKRLLDIGSEVPTTADRTPQALQSLVESEVSRWSLLLKAAGATAK